MMHLHRYARLLYVGRLVLYNRFYQKHQDHSCYDFENARPPFLWRFNHIHGAYEMKISVIIPAYNCAKYIRQTLDCVRLQTFPSRDLEVIVYLDGCTDGTDTEISQYAQDYPKFNLRAIRAETNCGVSGARNAAITVARGEYIHFMDADDVINTDFYKNLYDAAKRTDSDVAVAGFIHERWPGNSIVFDHETVLILPQDKIDATGVDMHGYSWRYLIRRDFWNHNRFEFPTDMKYCEDLLIMTKTVYYSNRIVLVPNSIYTYKYRPNSMLTTRSTRKLQAKFYHSARCTVYIFMCTFELRMTCKKYQLVLYRLFGFFPLLKLRYTTDTGGIWVYLFGCIPLCKVRKKIKTSRPLLK